MEITVIGTGYVGLVTSLCLSECGHKVTALDIDKKKIKLLKQSISTIYEPLLDNLLGKNLLNKSIIFTSSFKQACRNNIIFLCIDTPGKVNGAPDTRNLYNAVRLIAANASKNTLVITKSTVPLGENKRILSKLNAMKTRKDIVFDVCANPEFLREGSAVSDFNNPDRIICGLEEEKIKKLMLEIYFPIESNKKKFIFMSFESAELTKYASNSYLATKISFINEMSELSENCGASIDEVKSGMSMDPRIGKDFLNAGLGFGGSCFPKDINALIHAEDRFRIKSSLLKETLKRNAIQLKNFEKKIITYYKKDLSKKHLSILGLSFKPNTDDIRESISIKLINRLSPRVRLLNVFDPAAMRQAEIALNAHKNINFCDTINAALSGSDGLILCTEWDEFRVIDASNLVNMKEKVIFDGRNILQKFKTLDSSVKYFGMGL